MARPTIALVTEMMLSWRCGQSAMLSYGGDELVGVVLAVHLRRHGEVQRRDDAADREVLPQEALAERVRRQRITEGREGQLIRRRRGRIGGEPVLHRVEHHGALGQPHGGAATTCLDGMDEVALTHVDRLADARAVKSQPRETVIQLSDAGGEQSLQGVPLNLTCRILDVHAIQAGGEPVGARAADVLVIGNTEDMGTTERVRVARGVPR